MEIIIAAPDRAVLQRFSGLAERYGEPFEVSGWEGLHTVASQTTPILFIVDVLFLRDDPGALLRELFASIAGIAPVLFLTDDVERDEDLLLESLCLGAAGCLRLSMADDMAQQAIGIVTAGEAWIDRHLLGRLLNRLPVPSKPLDPRLDCAGNDTESSGLMEKKLTLREREILEQIVSGKANKDIARTLDISERTVKAHLTAIYRKLEVVDRVKLILLMQGRKDRSE